VGVRVRGDQRLELEGCVIKVAEPKKKAGSKQGKAAAKKKKQDQFERVKQAKNKKNKNNKKGRQPAPAPKMPNKEGSEQSEDDEYAQLKSRSCPASELNRLVI
jgi:hypothetical protein